MKLNEYFDVIHRYRISKRHNIDELRKWCDDNLQSGYDFTTCFDSVYVNVTDDIDYDLLILTWGTPPNNSWE